MIIKGRLEPPELFQLQSLLNRMPVTHSQFPHWTEKLRRISAGYHGEQRVDSFWHDIELPTPHYFIHDLFIQKQHSSHQIDTLVITSHFVLILEIKSISGLLHFDVQTRQFSRTNKDGSIDGMRNPDDQVRRHEIWMKRLLLDRKLKLPVVGAIIFTYPSAVIQSRSGKRIMLHSSGLPHLLDQLLLDHPQAKVTKKQTELLAKELAALHSEKPLTLQTLMHSLSKGVLCPICEVHPMMYTRKRWRCSICHFAGADCHLLALKQYRCLFGPTISNKAFRDFTGISSITTASKLLKSANMPYRGSFKDRVYIIPD